MASGSSAREQGDRSSCLHVERNQRRGRASLQQGECVPADSASTARCESSVPTPVTRAQGGSRCGCIDYWQLTICPSVMDVGKLPLYTGDGSTAESLEYCEYNARALYLSYGGLKLPLQPSSDSTAVDSGSEASSSHNLSSSPKPSGFTDSFKPKLSSWAELGASLAQRVATAASPPSPPTDWAKSLRNLSEIKLNANSLPFKTEYESPFQTRSPAPNPPTAPSTPSWPKTIPPEFMPIVKVLKKQQKQGQDRLDFSMLGSLLRQECPNAYERAGVTKLKEYTNLAQEHGIVVSEDDIHGPGGIDGQRWVSLHPRLMGAKVYQASASG